MAPTKDKREKLTVGEGSDIVLDYLRKQNRPYSATDVSSNLLNRVSKTHTAKYLKDLHDKKLIEGRVSGKQIVYHALQQAPDLNAESDCDTALLDEKLNEIRDEIGSLKTTERLLKSELAIMPSIRSIEEMQSTITALETQKAGLSERLATLQALPNDTKPIGAEERKAIEDGYEKWKQETKLRKQAVKNLWTVFLDIPREGSLSIEEFWDSVGCEGCIPCFK